MKKTILIVCAALLVSGTALAGGKKYAGGKDYEVTITNITAGQAFTPILAATHVAGHRLFILGESASSELEQLAEGGATMPLEDALLDAPGLVTDTATTAGLLMPGDSVTFTIKGRSQFDELSFAAMLLPTHDTFVSITGMPLPRWSMTMDAQAYDAGTELNTEICTDIPGPFCMGSGYTPSGGEGYVHIANGIHGIGDLEPATFDWRSSVARVHIRRVK